MIELGTLLGWIAFALLGIWRIYWFVSEQKAEKEKPKEGQMKSIVSKRAASKFITLLAFGVVGVQLLGVSLFEMPVKSLTVQILGFLLVILGLGIAAIGRYSLGANWANCYEYQVKRKQELVTTGIYHYIRHPLYIGIFLFYIGGELLVQSYLVYIYMFALLGANKQAKWEEKLLIEHFGDQYRRYMKRTKRFIPFVW
jgi:protein-S-isoprenylcysteine O-methyltransferase Ste14